MRYFLLVVIFFFGIGSSAAGDAPTFEEAKAFLATISAAQSAHEVLGLSPDASEKEVKKKAKSIALKFHPDKALDANKEFKGVLNEILRLVVVAKEKIENGDVDNPVKEAKKYGLLNPEERFNDLIETLEGFSQSLTLEYLGNKEIIIKEMLGVEDFFRKPNQNIDSFVASSNKPKEVYQKYMENLLGSSGVSPSQRKSIEFWLLSEIAQMKNRKNYSVLPKDQLSLEKIEQLLAVAKALLSTELTRNNGNVPTSNEASFLKISELSIFILSSINSTLSVETIGSQFDEVDRKLGGMGLELLDKYISLDRELMVLGSDKIKTQLELISSVVKVWGNVDSVSTQLLDRRYALEKSKIFKPENNKDFLLEKLALLTIYESDKAYTQESRVEGFKPYYQTSLNLSFFKRLNSLYTPREKRDSMVSRAKQSLPKSELDLERFAKKGGSPLCSLINWGRK